MRVIVASRIFAPEPAAAAFRLEALTLELLARGHEVEVLTTRFENARSETRARLRIRRAAVARSRDGFVRGYLSYLSFDTPLFFRLVTARRAAVVVVEPPPTSGLVALVACAIRRTPVVWYAADVWSDAAVIAGASRPVIGLLRRVEAFVMRRAAAVLAVSTDVGDRVRELSGREAVVVGNGVDTGVFEPGAKSTPSATTPTFVYAGTASEFQGAQVFVDAFAELLRQHPSARLTMLGGGQDAAALAARAGEFDDGALTVLARQSALVAADQMRRATASLASIVPGVGYDFAVPTKIYASSACGTPVIFAGPDAAASLVVRSAPLGWAVPYDAFAIADAMGAAIDESTAPEHTARRGQLSAWAVRNGSLAEVARRVADVVEGVVGSREDRLLDSTT